MRALIAKIHVAKDQLGLDDYTYCAVLKRVTGRTSSRDLTRSQAIRVIQEFKRSGWSDKQGRSPAKTVSGKYAPILRALWLSAYNLGVARSRDDKALLAFVQRQTGLSHTRFLTEPGDAKRAIEAMKKWLTRDAGVEWPGQGPLETKRAIVLAQWRRLIGLGAINVDRGANPLDGLGEYVAKITRTHKRAIGDIHCPTITAVELDQAQAALGRRIRAVLAKKREAT